MSQDVAPAFAQGGKQPMKCAKCSGTGKVKGKTCASCKGTGKTMSKGK